MANLFGSGFLYKRGDRCFENQNIYQHYGIVLVLSGEAVHIDAEGKAVKVSSGCVIQRIPGKKQSLRIRDDGSWQEFFVCVGKDVYDAMVSMGLLNDRQEIFRPGLSDILYNECCGLLAAMESSGPATVNLLLPRAMNLILMLRCNCQDSRTEISEEEKRILDEACRLLSDPVHCPGSLQDLVGRLGMGYEKFRKLFKEYTGLSPQGYAKEKKLAVAKQLLLYSEKSIKEIAYDMGFCDQYAFSRQFRSETGMPPSQYRVQGCLKAV